ncbi:ATP-binding protein [Aestuariispira insulae]|uniref:histidine kinase n=1 Tax=Aestuariispira insulae TaxID=1461337 RepID=A0A3D9HF33_9PROT|nr:ATP-binding protein [Aestuariispira insulae]RED48097.1 PAS domain S-box-containing protein [Aestuariispira insulae]
MILSPKNRSGLYFFATVLVAVALFTMSVFTAERFAAEDQEHVFLEQQALLTQSSAASMQQRLDFLSTRAGEVALTLSEAQRGPVPGNRRSAEILTRALSNFGDSVRFIHYGPDRQLVAAAGFESDSVVDQQLAFWLNNYWQSENRTDPYLLFPDFLVTNSHQIAAVLFPIPANDLRGDMTRGLLVSLVDIADLSQKYVSPLRSGEFGAGYLMNQAGTILYDHETEIIGRSVFDGMHVDYPDLRRFDNRLISEKSGVDTYHFTRKRSGAVVRKLAAWDSVSFGPHKFIIALSAPDSELAAGMNTMRWLSLSLGAILTLVIFLAAWFFMMMRTHTLRRATSMLEQQVADNQDALSESKSRLTGFAAALPDLGFLFDAEGRYLEIYGDERLLIRNRQDLIGKRFSDLLPHDVASKLKEVVSKTLETGKNQFVEYCLTIQGSEVIFEGKTSLVPATKRAPALVAFVTRDVTSLRQAEQRLHAAIESMADGVTLWDEEDRLALYNEEYLQIYPFLRDIPGGAVGKTYEEILRYTLEHINVVSDRAQNDREGWINKRLRVHRDSSEDAYIARLDDGRWISVRERSMGQGWIVGIRSDITPLKQAEQDALEARITAEMASKAKSEFLANMSHELRTPLNAILGLAEMIQRQELGPVGNDRYVEYADDIRTSGQHLLTLLNDILNLSRIEIGTMELQEESIDLVEIIEASTRIVKGLAEAKSIHLSTAAPQNCPILGDGRALRQILLNLLSNAIKFTNSGGDIAVRLVIDDAIRLSVTDNGIGIDAADIDRVLEPFVQLSHPGTAKEPGTGIGLALSKQLAELHGGNLSMESTPDVGTTVTLTLSLERRLPEQQSNLFSSITN